MPVDEMIERALAEIEVLEINAGKRLVSRPSLQVHPLAVKEGTGGWGKTAP